jgi:hypothetical protein
MLSGLAALAGLFIFVGGQLLIMAFQAQLHSLGYPVHMPQHRSQELKMMLPVVGAVSGLVVYAVFAVNLCP